jgi:hypothetical protein
VILVSIAPPRREDKVRLGIFVTECGQRVFRRGPVLWQACVGQTCKSGRNARPEGDRSVRCLDLALWSTGEYERTDVDVPARFEGEESSTAADLDVVGVGRNREHDERTAGYRQR